MPNESVITENLDQSEPQPATVEIRHRWQGLSVVLPVEGTFNQVLEALPYFGRQPFAIASVNGDDIGINPFLDVVYRVPTHQGEKPVPLGVVSKNYRLVDHHQVLRTLERTLTDCGLSPGAFQVRAQWTINGERAHFSVLFPPGCRFTMPVMSERDEMRFRIEIFNSVEGSCRLIAVAGWLRSVCLNGLIVGTALFHLQRQHRQQLQIDELGSLVRDSIDAVEGDKSTFGMWLRQSIDGDVLVPWINDVVRLKWGIKAAVRVFSIATHGTDVELVGDIRNRPPTEIKTRRLKDVPGVNAPVSNAFGVSQVLSWVAGQRTDLDEHLEWRSQVQELMDSLISKTGEVAAVLT